MMLMLIMLMLKLHAHGEYVFIPLQRAWKEGVWENISEIFGDGLRLKCGYRLSSTDVNIFPWVHTQPCCVAAVGYRSLILSGKSWRILKKCSTPVQWSFSNNADSNKTHQHYFYIPKVKWKVIIKELRQEGFFSYLMDENQQRGTRSNQKTVLWTLYHR